MRALQQVSCFRQSNIVLIPECNLGNDAQYVSKNMVKFPNVSVLSSSIGYYGVFTGTNKRRYVERAAEKFAEAAVSYHGALVAANPFMTDCTPKQKVNKAKAEFHKQLSTFERLIKMPGRMGGRDVIDFSGRVDGEYRPSASKRDDMVMAYILGLFYSGMYNLGEGELVLRGSATRLRDVNEIEAVPDTVPFGAVPRHKRRRL